MLPVFLLNYFFDPQRKTLNRHLKIDVTRDISQYSSQDGKKNCNFMCVCYLLRSDECFSSLKKINPKNEMDQARSMLRMMSQKTFRNCKIECSGIKLFTHFIRCM